LKRDTEHFLSVIEANKGIIYKIANAYCKDEESRKDLVQEIIVQLWLAFSKYDEQYKLSTWMYRIALNVSISFYSKEQRRSNINHALPQDIIQLKADQAHATDENIQHLYLFIRELKEIDRAVILLYLEGNNQQEIARITGLTVTNVATKVQRIKQQLQQKFSTIKSS